MLEIIGCIILPVITFVLGWVLNKRLSDRPFLINDIYSPLYEEVKMMSKNISEFKSCYSLRYGRPDYSAPLPRDKVLGYVRQTLILTGKYEKVPKYLRAKLNDYYSECEEYNLLLNSATNKEKITLKLRNKQEYLKNPEDLLRELKNRIRDPNPLFKLGRSKKC